jgi:hypothetical protein
MIATIASSTEIPSVSLPVQSFITFSSQDGSFSAGAIQA